MEPSSHAGSQALRPSLAPRTTSRRAEQRPPSANEKRVSSDGTHQHEVISKGMEDKTIVCVDCQQPFVFTGGEQQFYAERGLLELPKRCKPCRGQRRRRLSRRRKGGVERGENGAPLEAGMLGAAGVDAAPEAGPSGNGATPAKEKAAPSGPRTFWDERPEWVRQAMLKAAPASAPAGASREPQNGATPARGKAAAPPPEEGLEPAADAAGEGRRRRRRSRRRRRRGTEEPGGRSRDDAGTPASPDVVEPAR